MVRSFSRMAIMAAILSAGAAHTQPLGLQTVHEEMSDLIYVTHAGDGSNRLFLVNQEGIIYISRYGTLLPQPFLDIQDPVSCCGETGLLGLAFDPNYENNGRFYVNYTTSIGGQLTTRVSRFTAIPANADRADSTTEQMIIEYAQPQSNHNAGWLGFGPDGYLYIASGDGGGAGDDDAGHGTTGNGQNRNTLLGKMLRLDVSGQGTGYSVPPTNPFVGQQDVRTEIWSYGLRNPWRASFDRLTGDLYIADVGQGSVEEVNYQPTASTGGENYGWRVMEGNNCFDATPDGGNPPCNDASLTAPIHTYSHAGDRCSVTGGYVYRGEAMPSSQGLYFFADYCTSQVYSFRYTPGGGLQQFQERTAELEQASNITSFGEDEAGELYIVSFDKVTKVYDRGVHRADTDHDGALGLSEVIRVVQLYNAGRYSCATSASEDEYQVGPGSLNCIRHTTDYLDPQGVISLSELLRTIQLYNVGAYTWCGDGGEDGLCAVV